MTHDWRVLQDAIAGEVVLPGSSGYDQARKPPIARFHDVRPLAVVRCRSAADVAEAIWFAGRYGLRVAARSGGHCFAGRSSTTGIVIDVSPMDSVSVADGVATIGAGARLGSVYDALEQHGLTIVAGCGPTVGIAGLTLGGGLGILGRKHGLTSDQLLGAQVVLADGRIVDCDEQRDEELFWALRGAGHGTFGVVTSLIFRTLPAPAATSFQLLWRHTDAAAVIDAWQAWAPDTPDELAASLLVTAPADPGRPPAVEVFGAMIGSGSATTALLDELIAQAGTEPESAAHTELPYRDAKRHLAERGGDDEPGHLFSKSEYFRRPLPADAVRALLDHFVDGRVAGEARELDFSPWGGAYNRVAQDATAFAHRDERFLLKHAVVIDAGTAAEAAERWLERSWATVHQWGAGRVYPNFPDPDLADAARAYHGPNHDRVLRIKRRYDPSDFFATDDFSAQVASHTE
jgi:FAD/FMN-containing dehydrogenase